MRHFTTPYVTSQLRKKRNYGQNESIPSLCIDVFESDKHITETPAIAKLESPSEKHDRQHDQQHDQLTQIQTRPDTTKHDRAQLPETATNAENEAVPSLCIYKDVESDKDITDTPALSIEVCHFNRVDIMGKQCQNISYRGFMTKRTVDWIGKSGKKYRYRAYDIGTSFKQSPGNYVFARETEPSTLRAIYIGQTGDLSERFDDHHRMPCIRQNRATYICAHTSSADEATRKAEEDDLIRNYNPVCNR